MKGLECLADIQNETCTGCGYIGIGIYPICVREVSKDALALLKAQPEVVRCKDCKHGERLFADYVSCQISEENESGCHVTHRPDFFCADGFAKDINVPDKEGR